MVDPRTGKWWCRHRLGRKCPFFLRRRKRRKRRRITIRTTVGTQVGMGRRVVDECISNLCLNIILERKMHQLNNIH
jgi:hypothetical protein